MSSNFVLLKDPIFERFLRKRHLQIERRTFLILLLRQVASARGFGKGF